MKNSVLKIFMTLLLLLYGLTTFAQGGIPLPDGGDDEYPVSIDMGIVWLILAGVVLGTYFMFKKHRKLVK